MIICTRAHFDIASTFKCKFCGFFFVLCHSVCYKFANCIIIAYYCAVIAPFFSENFIHKPLVSNRRNTVQRIKRWHKQFCTGINTSLVCRKIKLAQSALCNVNRVIISARFGAAVTCIMLYTCADAIGIFQIITLECLDACGSDSATEHRFLTAGFHYSSPSCITCIVYHWCKGYINAVCRSFKCRHF